MCPADRKRFLDGGERRLIKLQTRALAMFAKMRRRAGSGDRDDMLTLMKKPGDGQAGRRGSHVGCQRAEIPSGSDVR